MPPIIYDVAVSIDGFIAGPGGDVSAFAPDGPVVDDYQARLETYACAIMGRATYEFGYRYGMKPGDNPYSHMNVFVFSKTLALPEGSNVEIVRDPPEQIIPSLRRKQDGPIYLCGGGAFAGSLLECGLVDKLRLKRAPAILGGGVPIFKNASAKALKELETRRYDNGYLYQEFEIVR